MLRQGNFNPSRTHGRCSSWASEWQLQPCSDLSPKSAILVSFGRAVTPFLWHRRSRSLEQGERQAQPSSPALPPLRPSSAAPGRFPPLQIRSPPARGAPAWGHPNTYHRAEPSAGSGPAGNSPGGFRSSLQLLIKQWSIMRVICVTGAVAGTAAAPGRRLPKRSMPRKEHAGLTLRRCCPGRALNAQRRCGGSRAQHPSFVFSGRSPFSITCSCL